MGRRRPRDGPTRASPSLAEPPAHGGTRARGLAGLLVLALALAVALQQPRGGKGADDATAALLAWGRKRGALLVRRKQSLLLHP